MSSGRVRRTGTAPTETPPNREPFGSLHGRRLHFCFFFQAEDGIRDLTVTGVQTCALPILRKHPNADRLTLCRVDVGGPDGPVEVVCGAPNVQAGKVYPYAPVGGTLPGGVRDRKSVV